MDALLGRREHPEAGVWKMATDRNFLPPTADFLKIRRFGPFNRYGRWQNGEPTPCSGSRGPVVENNQSEIARNGKLQTEMKTTILDSKSNANHARGAPHKSGALLACVALALAVPGTAQAALLHQETFNSDPQWMEGGNTFAGQMIVTGGKAVLRLNNMGPTDPDGIDGWSTQFFPFWEPENPTNWTVQFQPGHTVELRTDVVQFNQPDAFAGLGVCNFQDETGYSVWVDRNEIMFFKFGLTPSEFTAFFFWSQVTLPPTNLVLSAAFTPVGTDLAIHIQILEAKHQTVLWETNVTDTAGFDPVLPNRAVKGLLMHPEGIPAPYVGTDLIPFVAVMYCNPSRAPMGNVEVTVDNVQLLEYHPPYLEIAMATNGVVLKWLLSREEHIVVHADHLAGPWYPCPQSCTRIDDIFCLTVPCQSQAEVLQADSRYPDHG